MQQPTSIAANTASKPNREYNYNKILNALDKLPNNEGIADTIAAYTTIDKIEVSRRMGELAASGKVVNTGRKGITAKGCAAIIWRKVYDPPTTKQISMFQ